MIAIQVTHKQERGRTSSACTAAIDASKDLYIRSSTSGLWCKLNKLKFYLVPETLNTCNNSVTATLKFGLTKRPIAISHICSHPAARGVLPLHNMIGRPNPGTSNSDLYACQSPGSQNTTINRTETKQLSDRSGSYKGPAHYYRVFHRYQEQDARGPTLSRHPKPKLQSSIKEKVNKCHKLKNVLTQCNTKIIRGRAIMMAMSPPPPTKHTTPLKQRDLS